MNLNIKDKENQKFYRAQRLALYWLLGLIYFGFIGLQLGRIQAIADFSYSLHEFMYLPVNIAIFVVPFLFLIYIFLFIRYLLRRGKQKPNFSFQAVLVIASIIFVFSITAHQSQEVSTGGVFKVEEKLKEGTKYYLELDNKKVRVSYNEFQLVEENQQYLISFVWNKRTPNIGKLDTIEPLGD